MLIDAHIFTAARARSAALTLFGFCSCGRPKLNTRTRSMNCSRSKRSRYCPFTPKIKLFSGLTASQAQLAADEESFWQEQLVTLLQAASAQDEEQALRQQTEAANAHLAVLRRSHVLNDCFHIMPGDSASSPFSTINGFKIGIAVFVPPFVSLCLLCTHFNQCSCLHPVCVLNRPE